MRSVKGRWTAIWGLGLLLAAGPSWSAGKIVIRLEGRPPAANPPTKAAAKQPEAPKPAVTGVKPRDEAAPAAVYGRLAQVSRGPITIRRQPIAGASRLIQVPKGQRLVVRGTVKSWYAVLMADGSLGYLPQSNLELLPYQVTELRRPAASAVGSAGNVNIAALREAYRYLGVKYVWGGNGFSGVDCSGLVKNCFSAEGVKLPRRASRQARVGYNVPLTQLRPGDRLYFSVKKQYDHTGIYIGQGYFIHASSSRGKVAIDHLSKPLYGKHLSAARRF